jgi:hypothetical protein
VALCRLLLALLLLVLLFTHRLALIRTYPPAVFLVPVRFSTYSIAAIVPVVAALE